MVIHWIDHNEMWSSSGYKIYYSRDYGNTFNIIKEIPVSPLINALYKSRILCRLLRLGVRAFLKLKNGSILIVISRKMFLLSNGSLREVFSFEHGIGPLTNGLCEDPKGNIYLGEYFPNNTRKIPVKLYKSEDQGRTWQIILSLKGIRHIHCVQYDPFDQKIWMCTGDKDKESSILFSEDEGETWICIGKNDQMFRTMSLLFTKDHVYWGTDTPSRQSYIYRYHRKTGKIERLIAVNGPVYHSVILGSGIKFFSTGVEGNSEGKSAAWDKKACIWASLDGERWENIICWEKDLWPYIFGYGRVLFARGRSENTLVFTTQSLKNVDNISFIGNFEV